MLRTVGTFAFLIALVAAAATAIAATSRDGASQAAVAAATPEPPVAAASRKPIEYEASELFIEKNGTDKDAGLQMELDGQKWRSFKLRDPDEDTLVDIEAEGRLRDFGLTENFFESSEPPFDRLPFNKFKKRFPEGKYTFRGHTIGGRKLVGSDKLSHLVPHRPNVTSPEEGDEVDPDGFTVTWDPVTSPAGVEIVRYIVIVTQEDPDVREVSMDLRRGATSASIPGEFLRSGTDTEIEVLAREKSGNQTITEFEVATE
jgi:hypothetical protein